MRTSPTGRLAHDLDRASDKDDEWYRHSTRSPAKERFSVATDETQRDGHWWVHLGLEMVVQRPPDLRRSADVAAATSIGYCMKCNAQREIKAPKQITMKNGRPATEGSARSVAPGSSRLAPASRRSRRRRRHAPMTSLAKPLVNLAKASERATCPHLPTEPGRP